ncbi:phosphoribosylglycinamide formyltransferase [Actinospongicola halichondriae]|uniref:phosphoribosylglycinamide formyltransferase n=1 Tax=Actinospongicola halichondriae TaxID=3236844 RepID=UPI003D497D23
MQEPEPSETGPSRVGVLASGSGTLLDAILSDGIPVDVVMVDRPCRATEVAERHGVAHVVHERTSFGASFDREGYTAEAAAILQDAGVDLVVMAGYGTVFGQAIHDAYPFRILNTHPALLPAFKGWHAVEAALEYGVKVTGCTIHVATLEMDAGPILAQEAVPILDGDTAETLQERIKVVERRLYPDTIRAVLAHPELLDPVRPLDRQVAEETR